MKVGKIPRSSMGGHGLHITVLRKTVMTELVQVEKRGEVSIHLEGFMVKALEDLARNVGPHSIFGMVACCLRRRWEWYWW
ncbi:hypothetical protein OIU74_001653 [Salix koriyanagi]|uniref:Uncharacterized protein n=1 Tax=Salix koriyanagi TaxID=2511006 RepID=A0A9Q1ANB7_9ROSI|nr:hypothetical protein OIU74_001653 [Salix koriyanagi]